MSCDLDEATPVGAIYRVGREPDAWELPDWRFATGEPPTFGMRFDDAEGEYRVLYAGSSELACFVETTATYRLDAVLEAALGDIEVDEDDREAGEVHPATCLLHGPVGAESAARPQLGSTRRWAGCDRWPS